MFIIMALCNDEDSSQFFRALYEQYKPLMYNIALRYIKDPSSAEELVHDAIVKLIEKEDTIVKLERCTLTAYIVYTIRNLSMNYLRRKNLEHRYFADVEEVVMMSERRENFIKIWNTLPDATRTLLEGKYILGLSDNELAIEFCCSPNSIRMKLTRARRQVIKLVKERGFSFEPA